MPDIGASPEHIDEFAEAVAALGGEVRVSRCYARERTFGTSQFNDVRAAHAAGRDVMLSVKVAAGATMAAIASGQFLPHYQQIARDMVALGLRDFYYIFQHEPEDDVERGDFTAPNFRAASRNVYNAVNPIIHPAGGLSAITLMEWTIDPSSGRNVADYFVPEADMILWDSYNKGNAGDPPKPAFRSSNPVGTADEFIAGLNACADYAESKGKLTGIAETGTARRNTTAGPAERAAAWELVEASGVLARFKVVCHYENGVIDGRAEYAIRGERPSLQAFIDACAVAEDPDDPPPPPPPGDCDEALAALEAQLLEVHTELAAVASELDQARSQVETLQGVLTQTENARARLSAVRLEALRILLDDQPST